MGGECRYLGAQVCLISAGKVAEKGSWTADALSAAPAVVARLSDTLLAGIAEAGVQGCARPLRDLADVRGMRAQDDAAPIAEDIVSLNAGAAMPLQRPATRGCSIGWGWSRCCGRACGWAKAAVRRWRCR